MLKLTIYTTTDYTRPFSGVVSMTFHLCNFIEMVLRGSLGSECNLDKEVKLFQCKGERTEGGASISEA